MSIGYQKQRKPIPMVGGSIAGQKALADQGRQVTQGPVNFSGKATPTPSAGLAGSGVGTIPSPPPPAAPAQSMPMEAQNRAFRQRMPGTGNFGVGPAQPYHGTGHAPYNVGVAPVPVGGSPPVRAANLPGGNAAATASNYSPSGFQVLNPSKPGVLVPSSGMSAQHGDPSMAADQSLIHPQSQARILQDGLTRNSSDPDMDWDPRTSSNPDADLNPLTGSDPSNDGNPLTNDGVGGSADWLNDIISKVTGGLGGAVGAAASGFADKFNDKAKSGFNEWYADENGVPFGDLQKNKEYGESLMDPNVQNAAEQAGRDQLRSDVNYNTDRQLRMMGSAAAGGGRMGGGAVQAAYDSGNKAIEDGQRKLIQDAFTRKLQAGQLGSQITSDRAKEIYGLLNDERVKPAEIAAIMAQLFGDIGGSALQAFGQAGKNPFL